jgi:nitrite reductase (NADH) small subunit
MLIEAAAESELHEGIPIVRRVRGRELLLVLWQGRVFAVRNVCPHQSLPLASGRVHAALSGRRGSDDISVEPDTPVLQCPVHAWTYDLSTGRCAGDPRIRVKAYETQIVDGRVLVDDGRP